jgi:hypothetical protein
MKPQPISKEIEGYLSAQPLLKTLKSTAMIEGQPHQCQPVEKTWKHGKHFSGTNVCFQEPSGQ